MLSNQHFYVILFYISQECVSVNQSDNKKKFSSQDFEPIDYEEQYLILEEEENAKQQQ